jgi:hypothetical protein
MFQCDCGRKHKLNDDHYKLISEGREIHLVCINCNWGIIIGADEEEEGFNIYSYAVENDSDTIGKVTSYS